MPVIIRSLQPINSLTTLLKLLDPSTWNTFQGANTVTHWRTGTNTSHLLWGSEHQNFLRPAHTDPSPSVACRNIYQGKKPSLIYGVAERRGWCLQGWNMPPINCSHCKRAGSRIYDSCPCTTRFRGLIVAMHYRQLAARCGLLEYEVKRTEHAPVRSWGDLFKHYLSQRRQ